MSADYDSPWKEALDVYFEPFLALLFPEAYRQIDWSRGHEPLDKEFQQLVREAEVGRRYVDKLVKVWRNDGTECWVLIHIEVQTARDADFAQRMYVYNYRVFDKYNRKVASLAVLADDDPDWLPDEYRSELFGCETGIRFPIAKLVNLGANPAALLTSTNPFAPIVLAHVKARETHSKPVERHAWKIRLVRGLYERGFSAADVRELFRLIDWLMELPATENELFWQELNRIEEEKRMPFVTSVERAGLCKGMRKGIEALLSVRFDEAGLALMPQIEKIHEEEKLEAILNALKTEISLEALRGMCALTAAAE
jgi:hypothetical protein